MSRNPLDGFKLKPMVVKINLIDTNTFVRVGLDRDRVELMWLAAESGEKFPPIVLYPDYEINSHGEMCLTHSGRYAMVDGRNRLQMFDECMDATEVHAQVIMTEIKNEAQLIALAFQLNEPTGPLPPNRNDIRHTVEELLKRKVPKKDIPALLGLPAEVVKKFVNDVEAALERATTYRGYKLVVDKELSVPEAAKIVGTTPERIRNFIASGRRKRRQTDLESVKRTVASAFKSLTSTLNTTVQMLVKKYNDGDVSSSEVLGVLTSIDERQKRIDKSIKELHNRTEAKLNGDGK